MPNINISGPHIASLDKKRRLVHSVTEAAAEAYGLPKETIVVVIKENPPENVVIGGELVIDKRN